MTARAWAPFGALPVDAGDPNDQVELAFEWNDAHLDYISHSPRDVTRTQRGFRCEGMFRHATHTQALMPLNCEAVLAVAPPDVDFNGGDDLEEIRAFRVRPGHCFVLHRGTWHWGPFPLGAEPVRLLNLQGRRYRDDNGYVDFNQALATVVEVVP
jgi:ureidoglycolate hydrolase